MNTGFENIGFESMDSANIGSANIDSVSIGSVNIGSGHLVVQCTVSIGADCTDSRCRIGQVRCILAGAVAAVVADSHILAAVQSTGSRLGFRSTATHHHSPQSVGSADQIPLSFVSRALVVTIVSCCRGFGMTEPMLYPMRSVQQTSRLWSRAVAVN